MKKIFLLFTIGCSILLTACSDKASNSDATQTGEQGAANKTTYRTDSSGIIIAYYNQDDIVTDFRFYREIDSMLTEKQISFQNQLEQKIRAYQQYEADIQKRMENNEITGYQLEDIQRTAMQKQQAIQQFQEQKGGALQKESLDYQTALMNKIAQAGKEFSEERGIDILFFYQKGGQITYINDALDVTEDFISYLNSREDALKSNFDDDLEAASKENTESGIISDY